RFAATSDITQEIKPDHREPDVCCFGGVAQQQRLLERSLLGNARIVERDAAAQEARVLGINAVLDLRGSERDAIVALAPEVEWLAQSRTPELGRLCCVEPGPIDDPADLIGIDDKIERAGHAKNSKSGHEQDSDI